ncbi:hypothetical protein, partial [Enterobacter hormaechei]|uniref:hypothetical protein n=1 Tax=Enterobacter hormaechei TaxID=158836 RepID=UPI001C400B34
NLSAGIRVFKVTGRDQRWQHSSRCPNIFYALREGHRERFRRLFEEMRFLPEWRHKKTRLVRSGFYVLPRMEAGTTKTIDG